MERSAAPDRPYRGREGVNWGAEAGVSDAEVLTLCAPWHCGPDIMVA